MTLRMTLSLSLLVLTVVPVLAQPTIDPEADAILKKYTSWLQAADEKSVDIDVAMDMEIMGMNQQMTIEQSVAVKQPNRFRITARTMGMPPMQMVSDGEQFYNAMESFSIYSVQPAPENVGDINVMEMTGMPMGGLIDQGNFDVVSLFLKDEPYAYLTKNISTAEYKGVTEQEGTSYHVIALTLPLLNADLWFTQGDQPELKHMVPDISKALQQMGDMIPNADQVKMDMLITVNNLDLEPVFAEDYFQYTPPADAREVDNLMEALMENMAQQQAESQAAPPEMADNEGAPAPDFTADLLNGETFTLSAEKGSNVVVLDFWATWCPPCRSSMPVLEEIMDEYADKDVILIAVNQQETEEEITTFLKSMELDPTVAYDPAGEIAQSYGVRGFPTFVIVDKEGNIAGNFLGFDEAGIRSTLARLTQ